LKLQEKKQARAELARSKRRHSKQWSVKNIRTQGEKHHVAIRANAPVVGYLASYCGFMLQVCKENQQLAI